MPVGSMLFVISLSVMLHEHLEPFLLGATLVSADACTALQGNVMGTLGIYFG